MPIDRDDYVIFPHPARISRRARHHAQHQCAMHLWQSLRVRVLVVYFRKIRCERHDLHAEVGVGGFFPSLQDLVDLVCSIDGDRETNGLCVGPHHGVDANHLPQVIHQGPAAVSGIQGCVGLNVTAFQVRRAHLCRRSLGTGDHPQGDSEVQAHRAAHSDDPVSRMQKGGVSKRGFGQSVGARTREKRKCRSARDGDETVDHL
mmetsp:Transcript_33427/g.73635  ORF Transcript_33427/g.73635 Transcript_33427/m.73635 type:complete len:203 (-) Transcript_33427:164-772(-)